jgi:hypothetical protein
MRNRSLCLIVLILAGGGDSQSQTANHKISLAKKNENENKTGLTGVFFKQETGKIEISVAGSPFTTFYFQGYNKPVFYPLRAASGTIVTRGYPMIRNIPGETRDHPHHKGLWLTHGDVNGIDFWAETPKSGKIVHRKFEQLKNDDRVGILKSRNDWMSPEGKRVLEETREVKIHNLPNVRVIDFDFKLTAVEGPVKFGDTKEGTFGIRLAQPFLEKQGGRIENAGGGIGEKDCWGKRAEWVDFTTKIKNENLGIAIFDHPSSFRHPTYWHVRGYTLFAANPFGLHDFYDDKTKDGSFTLQEGESLVLRYRVYIHPGTTQEAQIANQYKVYADSVKFHQ